MELKNIAVVCLIVIALAVIIVFDIKAIRERAKATRACDPYEMVSVIDEKNVICKTADGGTELKQY